MSKVLIIGSGGREHALGWKLAQSEHVTEVLFAPGNGGTAVGKGRNLALDGANPEHWEPLMQCVTKESIDLIVVGPEAPLSAGIVDAFQAKGISHVFGPSQAASQLEADKFFSFDCMQRCDIPQANGACCRSIDEAKQAIHSHWNELGIVLKARGLAGGKGVVVCRSKEQAMDALNSLTQQYGPEILVSERLSGPEFSVFGISDGNRVYTMDLSLQDHKPLHNNDEGPNTGGMGAYGPVPMISSAMVHGVVDTVMTPVVQELKSQGTPYVGFLYAGMMLTEQGPKALEFNVRFGDPECQPTMRLLASDLYTVLLQSLHGNLEPSSLSFHTGASCCIVLASQGYPGAIKKGLTIHGLERVMQLPEVQVFHSGTRRVGDVVQTNGGRVLGVTAYASSGLEEATQRAYEAVQCLSIDGGFHYRTDIASQAIQRTHSPTQQERKV